MGASTIISYRRQVREGNRKTDFEFWVCDHGEASIRGSNPALVGKYRASRHEIRKICGPWRSGRRQGFWRALLS